jgi:hypothetical protein
MICQDMAAGPELAHTILRLSKCRGCGAVARLNLGKRLIRSRCSHPVRLWWHGEFQASLSQLDGASSDPETMAFWETQPDAYAAATRNPQPPGAVMNRFVDWVRGLAGDSIFAAHPLALDGP